MLMVVVGSVALFAVLAFIACLTILYFLRQRKKRSEAHLAGLDRKETIKKTVSRLPTFQFSEQGGDLTRIIDNSHKK